MLADRFESFRGRVRSGLARSVSLPSSTRDEIVSDTIEKVYRLVGPRADDMADDDVVQLLIRTAVNMARNRFRDESLRKTREGAYAEVTSSTARDEIEVLPEKLAVHAALGTLTPEDAELVWKVYCTQEWSPEDACNERGVSIATMKRTLFSLRAALRAKLIEMGAAVLPKESVESRA